MVKKTLKNIEKNIHFRKAKPKDINEIYNIFLELAKTEDNATKKLDKKLISVRKRKNGFKEIAKKNLLKSIRSRKSIYLVAEEVIDKSSNQNNINNKFNIKNSMKNNKTKIIGYCYFTLNKNWCTFFKKPPLLYLNSIVVSKEYRKKGISSKFMEIVNTFAKEHKCKFIFLDVISTNSAKEIYNKWGFKTGTETMFKRL